MSTIIGRPEPAEFSAHFAPYIAAVPDGDILDLLASSGAERDATVRRISETDASVSPPPGKWSIRMTLGHLADMERVMAYRALRIARVDRAPISGVDQGRYADNSYANERTIADLRGELHAIRAGTLALFHSFPAKVWQWLDVIEGDAVSARALAYIIVGHDLHHLRQLAERFGVVRRDERDSNNVRSSLPSTTPHR